LILRNPGSDSFAIVSSIELLDTLIDFISLEKWAFLYEKYREFMVMCQ